MNCSYQKNRIVKRITKLWLGLALLLLLTPKAMAATEVFGNISADATWGPGIYYVSSDVTVPTGVTLTIESGTIVKFATNTSLKMLGGNLNAVGATAGSIIFTAYTDDEGGDTNNDGPSSGTPNYWGAINFEGTGTVASRIVNAVVRYTGSTYRGGIYISGSYSVPANVEVSSSTITQGGREGIYIKGASPLIEGNIINDNVYTGILITGSSGDPASNATIRNNDITGNLTGLSTSLGSISPSTVTIENNRILDNSSYGIQFGSYLEKVVTIISGNTITGNRVPALVPLNALTTLESANTVAPNTQNQIELLGGSLTQNLTLLANNGVNVYYAKGRVTIESGATLTLSPGIIWKSDSYVGLLINGGLNAVGASNNKIIFTSGRDDSAGGDSDYTVSSVGQPGDWENIHFTPSSANFASRLENVVVRYAGGSSKKSALYFDRAPVDVVNSEISDSASDGIYLTGASPTIQGNKITGNTGCGLSVFSSVTSPLLDDNTLRANESGICVFTATPVIQNNIIENNREWGIHYYDNATNTPAITGNTITGNRRSAQLPASAVPNSSDLNTMLPNEINGLWILGNTRYKDLRLAVQTMGAHELGTYHVAKNWTMAALTTLTIDPGVILKFDTSSGLSINGMLSVLGTAARPVVFTSLKDDAYGGDSNLDGYVTAPAHGDWSGIALYDPASDSSSIDHAIIRYGSALYIDRNNTRVSNSEISHSKWHGVYITYAAPTLEGNDIHSNSANGVHLDGEGLPSITGNRLFANFGDGVEVTDAVNATVTGNEIFGNIGHGIRNDAANINPVRANDNWWGAIDGPGGVYTGSGDEISANVDLSGLLSDFRTNGTPFSYFDAGGSDRASHLVAIPKLTGTPSTEWGVDPTTSVLYDAVQKSIKADYTGLTDDSSYRLLLTYLSKDTGGTVQELTDINGGTIHNSLPLPSIAPNQYSFVVPSGSITSGNLQLNFHAQTGPRALVSGIYLLQETSSDNIAPTVAFTTPVSGATLLAGDFNVAYAIKGTAADSGSGVATVEVGIQPAGGSIAWVPVSTIDSQGNWVYFWSDVASNQYTLSVRATDESGNQSIGIATAAVSVDTDIPTRVTGVSAQPVGTQLRVTWPLSIDDGAGDNDVNRHEIYRAETVDGGYLYPDALAYSLLGQAGAGINQFDDTTAQPSLFYYYYVRVVDHNGNYSDSFSNGPFSVSTEADTTAPPDVTNLTASPTNLAGADISVYLAWNASANTDGDLVDQRLYISIDNGATFGNNAPDYNNGQYLGLGAKTLAYQVTGLTANRSYTFKITTVDAVPNESAGAVVSATPTGALTEVAELQGSISADSILGPGVFVAPSGFRVNSGYTLTLKPGTIIKFAAGQSMVVYGKVVANGTAASPVVLTAYTDDEYGGDTNGDGPSSGNPGYWRYVYISNSHGSRLDHTVVRYSGSSTAAIYLYSSSIEIVSSLISHSMTAGLYNYASSSLLQGNTITNNATHGLSFYSGNLSANGNEIINNAQHGIYLAGTSHAAIENNHIAGNAQYGIYANSAFASATITGNIIEANDIGLRVPASIAISNTNAFKSNQKNYIELIGADILQDRHLSVFAKGTPDEVNTYVVTRDDIIVSQYTTYTIDPGVVVKFTPYSGLQVNGALYANGAAGDEIVFTSFKDDFYGGDSNVDGNSTIPGNGDWTGITFNGSFYDIFTRFNYVKARYAGSNNIAALFIDKANIAVENSEFSNSLSNGIYIRDASPLISGNSIWGNAKDGIYIAGNSSNPEISFNAISTNLSDGVELSNNANATVTDNQIFMNREYGLLNTSTNLVNATRSWWGDADGSGPQQATTNSTGTGNPVSDNVDYASFRATPPIEFSYANFQEAGTYTYGSLTSPILTQGTLSDIWDTVNKRPDRTMAWDANAVVVDYSGLNPSKRYKARVSYFNGDTAASYQSLIDAVGNPIHSSLLMPQSSQLPGTPIQFEFSIPQAYHASGSLQLRFINDNPTTALKAAIPEIWLLEDVIEFTPPRLETIGFNDVDGNNLLSIGDEFHFRFTEAMDTTQIVDGTTDANTRLVAEGGTIYGLVNKTRWSIDQSIAIVTLTEGFTIAGNELVTPTGLADPFGNLATGSQRLSAVDTVVPELTAIDWLDTDISGALSLGDQYVFRFSEAMDTIVIRNGTTDANVYLRPESWTQYGDLNTVSWSADGRAVTVTVTQGYTIAGNEFVYPSSFIVDMAGNSVRGSQQLTGFDSTGPELVTIAFDDTDSSNSLSVGDRYVFQFNRPMDSAALSDNTTDANIHLSPEGKKYGDINRISWNTQTYQELAVEITAGFTILGNEIVNPSNQVKGIDGRVVGNTGQLTLVDTVAPGIVTVQANLASPVPPTNDYRINVQFSSVMNTAVEPLVEIINPVGINPVVPGGGIWSTTVHLNDTYQTPAITLDSSLDSALSVNVSGAQDLASNVMTPVDGAYEFVMQTGPPSITSHPIAPTVNYVTTNTVTLAGNREDGSTIWIGNSEVVGSGSGPWSVTLTLSQGANDFEVYAKNAAGTASASVMVRFFVDSVAPAINSIVPLNGIYTNAVPATVVVNYVENGSGIDVANSSLVVTKGSVVVAGNWTNKVGELVFTPNIEFTEGTYQAAVQLSDLAGHQSGAVNSTFVIDLTPPTAPGVNAPAIVNTPSADITGTKQTDTAILLNGNASPVVPQDAVTTWAYSAALVDGDNSLAFTARDRAGNTSVATTVIVKFDNTSPGAVTVIPTNIGDGSSVRLDWAGYDEVANGNDIKHYAVYQSATAFTDITGLTPITTVAAGTKTYNVTGLTNNQTYHFAVVAVDLQNNALNAVTSASIVVSDTQVPEEVTGLSVTPAATGLTVNWTHSANSAADLASYKVYVDNAAAVTLAATATSHPITGLAAASSHTIKVTAVDASGNESAGVSITGVTLLPNPTGVSAAPLNAMADVAWSAIAQNNLVKEYAIYVSTTAITTVDGMTPKLKVNNTKSQARIAGLTNGTQYSIAVTAINLSNGETKTVRLEDNATVTPQPDSTGPVISNITFNGSPLVAGATLSSAGTIALTATDPLGVSRVEFKVDGASLALDTNGSSNYSAYWDILAYTDGGHTLSITAYDTVNNATTVDLAVTLAVAPPAAPVITVPTTGLVTNEPQISVSGTAEKDTEVFVYHNATQVAGPIAVGVGGNFSATVTLVAGNNTLEAAAQNRGGLGAKSSVVSVTLDSSIPETPTGLTASQGEGLVKLAWNQSTDSRVKGYHIYRSTSAINDTSALTPLNALLLSRANYDDIPPQDGTYYYRVVAVNELGSASLPSNQASIVVDSTPPRALSISYTTNGNFDPQSGRMAPGTVSVRLEVSEPLLTTPFLSINPNLGLPIAVLLTQDSDTVYSGSFDIKTTTKSGTAYANFSARDRAGNRGTQVDVGATLEIDTDGPAVTQLLIAPQSPIKTDALNPTSVSMDITLNEAPRDATVPQFSYALSGAGRTAQPISDVVQTDALSWRLRFTLPTDAGVAAEGEMLSLVFSAEDDLANLGQTVTAENKFQVYQGELPPLLAPLNLRAVALPGGQVKLSWDAVTDAADYQIYRQAPGEAGLTAYQRSTGALELTDQTTVDGSYSYTVASVRSENGQEALSLQSNPVTVNADADVPGAPQNLQVSLVGAGIQALWEAPAGITEHVTYNLYRAGGTTLTDVSTLTPIQTNIGPNNSGQLGFVDTNPNPNETVYAVTAVDDAGNESPPSNDGYLNISLLPVKTLVVTLNDAGVPEVSWTHSDSTMRYNVYLDNATAPINTALITGSSYPDDSYNNNGRVYTVKAVDSNNVESIGRSVTLPLLSAQLDAASRVQRGVMNRLHYRVSNLGAGAVSGARLKVKVGNYNHTSDAFDVAANSTSDVSIVVGGYGDLLDISPLTTTIDITTATKEQVLITTNQDITVTDGALLMSLETQDMVRGTNAKVRFALTNSSEVETDIITATNGAASNDISLTLLDRDGNTLGQAKYLQTTSTPANGVPVITLSNKTTVARIAAGKTFTSNWIDIPIPSNAVDQVSAIIRINQYHHRLGETVAVTIPGQSSRKTVPLIDTAYSATVTSVTPANSFGDVPIVISGSAVDANALAMPDVPLDVVLTLNGFERKFRVQSDSTGAFSYSFTPLQNEGGVYKVSVVHPDVVERSQHGEFIISRIVIKPAILQLTLPKNYEEIVNVIKATSAEGTTATNVRLVFDALDQPGGSVPANVSVTTGAAVNLTSNQTKALPFTISANNNALSTGTLVFKVVSDESATKTLGKVTINYTFSEAQPAFYAAPAYIETGVIRGQNVTEVLTIENRGLAEMTDVNLTLLTDTGAAPPDWIYLVSPAGANLAVGQKQQVQLVAHPDVNVTNQRYLFNIHVSSSNTPSYAIPVSVSVVLDGIGGVLFKVSDIYTGWTGPNANNGLIGAKIRLQNEENISLTYEGVTSTGGELLLNTLTPGRYRYRVSAPNHLDYLGRVWIKPDVTVAESLLLDYNLVTVEWSVTEITIQDKYEITLSATFETDVPAAVVVLQPSSVTLPEMQAGDVYYGQLKLTNYGLIRADNLNFTPPGQDPYFRYEFLMAFPDSIGAGESLIIPYRAVALQALNPDSTSSGACGVSYQNRVYIDYSYECVNGDITKGAAMSSFFGTNTASCASASAPVPVQVYSCTYCNSGGGGGGFGGFGGGFGGGGGDVIPGVACPTPCPDGTCAGGDGGGNSGGG